MELRQLRAFLAIAEERSFTRAADRLYVVQSAVSSTIQTLERELGVTLIDRTSHPVSLTDAGEVLFVEAVKTLAAADAAAAAVEEVRGGLRGTVKVGIHQRRRGAVSVARVIREFQAEHPAVRVIATHAGGSAEMAEQVRSGALDLAFVALPGDGPAGVVLTTFEREPMSFVCHPDHPLAGEPEIHLADLRDGVFADVPSTWGTRILLERELARQGIERDVRYEINDMSGIADFVEQDLAVAVMPPSYVPPDAAVRQVPIVDGPVFVLSLASPADRASGPAAAALQRVIVGPGLEAVRRAGGGRLRR